VVPAKGCFQPSEHVSLVASPSGGAAFNQWLGDASGNTNPLDVTMSANKTIFADIVGRTTGVEDVPLAFALDVHPNPTTGPARIEYAVPRPASVSVRVYDIAGREVATLVDGQQTAGRHVVRWGENTRSNGLYFVRYETPAGIWTRKVALLR